MKLFTSTTTPEQFIGSYGPTYRSALVVDHTDLFVAAGGRIHVGLHATWAMVPGWQAFPVVCGEIVRIDTEDGPISGRCGCNVVGDLGACQGHAEERDGWLAMDESERCAWERDREGC